MDVRLPPFILSLVVLVTTCPSDQLLLEERSGGAGRKGLAHERGAGSLWTGF